MVKLGMICLTSYQKEDLPLTVKVRLLLYPTLVPMRLDTILQLKSI